MLTREGSPLGIFSMMSDVKIQCLPQLYPAGAYNAARILSVTVVS